VTLFKSDLFIEKTKITPNSQILNSYQFCFAKLSKLRAIDLLSSL
jgi:hypothetical protein